MFVIQHTSIWPNFVLIALRIHLTEMRFSQERNVTFSSNKKNHKLHIKGYFIAKNSFVVEVTFNSKEFYYSYAWSCSYVKERLPLARDLYLENSADPYFCFWLALLHSVSYFSFLYLSPSSSLCKVFDYVSSNWDEVLSINPSANVFVCLHRL